MDDLGLTIFDDNKESVVDVEDAVLHVASQLNGYVLESKIQGILFLAEMEFVQQQGKRLLDCSYQKNNTGVISKEIRSAIEDNIRARTAYNKGYRTRKYYVKSVNDFSLQETSNAHETVSLLVSKLADKDGDEIMQITNQAENVTGRSFSEDIPISANNTD